MSKAAASSARVGSVYYGFLKKARCERDINTPDTEPYTLELYLSLRAISAFVALFWPLLHDSKLPLGATDFSLHQPKPDH